MQRNDRPTGFTWATFVVFEILCTTALVIAVIAA